MAALRPPGSAKADKTRTVAIDDHDLAPGSLPPRGCRRPVEQPHAGRMTDTRAAAVAPSDPVRRLARRQGVPPDGADAPRRENEALRRHAARLSAAVRRIGASLDAAGARGRRDGRSRAELLGLAGRRLLTPLTSIKGSTAAALDAPADLGPGAMLQLVRVIDEQADRMADLIGGRPEARAMGPGSGGDGAGPRTRLADPAADDGVAGPSPRPAPRAHGASKARLS